jgi:hypothetical protein
LPPWKEAPIVDVPGERPKLGTKPLESAPKHLQAHATAFMVNETLISVNQRENFADLPRANGRFCRGQDQPDFINPLKNNDF